MRPASHSWGRTRNDRSGARNSEQNVSIAGCAHSSHGGGNYAVGGGRETGKRAEPKLGPAVATKARSLLPARGVFGPAVERNAVRQSVTLLRLWRAPLGSLGGGLHALHPCSGRVCTDGATGMRYGLTGSHGAARQERFIIPEEQKKKRKKKERRGRIKRARRTVARPLYLQRSLIRLGTRAFFTCASKNALRQSQFLSQMFSTERLQLSFYRNLSESNFMTHGR